MANTNVAGYLSVLFIFLGVLVAYIMWEYPNAKHFPWHTYITVYIQYFCAFGIVLLVPIDLSMSIVGRRSVDNLYYYDSNVPTVVDTYLTFYWTTLVLSNLVLVFEEQYNMDGYFTFYDRLKNCFKQLFYQSLAGIIFGVIFFGILVGEKVIDASMNAVLLTSVLITNTVGLVVLMFLLGYGLVVFPMMLWRNGNLEMRLLNAQQKAAKEFKVLGDTSLDISLCVSNVLKTKEELPRYADERLNHAIEVLVSECPPDFTSSRMGQVAADKAGKVTIDTLAALRQRLYYDKANYAMSQGRVEKVQLEAYFLEDLVDAKNRTDGVKKIKWSFKPEGSEREFKWYIQVQPIVYRVAAVLSAVMSVLCYLGVLSTMEGVDSEVSPFYVAVHDDDAGGNGITVFVLFTLGYACYICMWALFEMKIGSFMELVTNQGTWPLSMSFNARFVARVAAPLAFFYLGWLRENGTRSDSANDSAPTAFSKFYQLQVIPVMGNSFNTFFPVLMIVISACTATNVINRILVFMKLEDYQFGVSFISDEALREGKRQLSKRKKLMERQLRRQQAHSRIAGVVTSTAAAIKGMFSFLGPRSKGNQNGADEVNLDIEGGEGQLPATSEPAALEGWIEKRGGSGGGATNLALGALGTQWQMRYFKVTKPCILSYYKEKNSGEAAQGQIDLRIVMSFNLVDKKDKGDGPATKLELVLADKVIKLKFQKRAEAEKWRDGLQAWKDYAIDYTTYYGDFEEDRNKRGVKSSSPGASPKDEAEDYSAQLDQINVGSADEMSDEGDSLTKGMLSSSGSSSSKLGSKSASSASASAPATGLFSRFSPGRSKEPKAAASSNRAAGKKGAASAAPAAIEDVSGMSLTSKPDALEGWLEKKSSSKLTLGGAWQRRYCRVNEKTGKFDYFKSEDRMEPPLGSIDLRLVSDVVIYDEEGVRDAARFNIIDGSVDGKDHKMRALNSKDRNRWIQGLNDWRDYFLLNF